MSVPTILRSTDAGAPTLNGTAGSLYAVFKWALPLLGWSIEYDDGISKIAFRNDALKGSGAYFQLTDDDSHGTADARACQIKGYRSMTALDTGTDGFPASDAFLWKSQTLDATAREYLIIGDERSFWAGLEYLEFSNTEGYRTYYIGDFNSSVAGDVPFMLSFGSVPSFSNNGTASLFREAQQGWDSAIRSRATIPGGLLQNYNGQINPQNAWFWVVNPSLNTGTSEPFGAHGSYPDPISGRTLASRIFLADPDIVLSDSQEHLSYRGWLRGMLNPMHFLTADGEGKGHHSIQNDTVLGGINNGIENVSVLYVRGCYAMGNPNTQNFEHAYFFDIDTDWNNF